MKTITIYELMGLIKDDKAPKRIKYKDNFYDYKESENGVGYVRPLNLNGLEWLANRVDIDDKDVLNDEVEIIEEDKELKKIEKLNNVGNSQDLGEFKDKQQLNNHILKDKINEIIDYLKSKGE